MLFAAQNNRRLAAADIITIKLRMLQEVKAQRRADQERNHKPDEHQRADLKDMQRAQGTTAGRPETTYSRRREESQGHSKICVYCFPPDCSQASVRWRRNQINLWLGHPFRNRNRPLIPSPGSEHLSPGDEQPLLRKDARRDLQQGQEVPVAVEEPLVSPKIAHPEPAPSRFPPGLRTFLPGEGGDHCHQIRLRERIPRQRSFRCDL